jgi:hypothetical protein
MSGLAESKEWLRWLPYSIRRDGNCEFDLIEKKYAVTLNGMAHRLYYCPNKDEFEMFQTILAKYSEDDEQILDAYGPSDMTVYAVYRFVRR